MNEDDGVIDDNGVNDDSMSDGSDATLKTVGGQTFAESCSVG